MGCWSKTCGLSNLHITDGEPVYTFVLVQNSSIDRCYNTSFFRPVLVPFECNYNDYGGGDNAHGIVLDPLMQVIKENCNISKDDEFDVDQFFDLVHDNEITYNNPYGGGLIDFVMIRKDVVDYVLDNWTREVYIAESSGYQPYTYQEVLSEIPEFIEVLTNKVSGMADPDDPTHSIMFSIFKLKSSSSFSSFFEESPITNRVNLVVIALMHDIHNTLFNLNDHIIELIVKNKVEELTVFLTDYIKGAFINCLLDKTRKQWMPGCHEGSQACDHDGYRILMNATAKSLDDELQKWDDEYL